MNKTFSQVMKHGCATISYPAAPLDLPEGYRGRPDHKEAMCIACSACAIACPPNAISMHLDEGSNNIVWNICYGRCIFCGRCEEVCPVNAIELSQDFELAVLNKPDLTEECAYPIARCRKCGKPYASAKEIDYAKQVLVASGGAAAANVDVCDICEDCRRKDDANALKHMSKRSE